jgi:hypothetical protein
MIYFFHHYELPAIEHQNQVRNLLVRVNQQNPVRGLVTVISQTSPTQISRFTLDASTLEGPVSPPQAGQSPSATRTNDFDSPSEQEETAVPDSSTEHSTPSAELNQVTNTVSSSTGDAQSTGYSVSPDVFFSPPSDASSDLMTSQTVRDPNQSVPAAAAAAAASADLHQLSNEPAACEVDAVGPCVDSARVDDVRQEDALNSDLIDCEVAATDICSR